MLLKRNYFIVIVVVLFAMTPSRAEFQVNTRTSSDQANAAIAMDNTGNFVIVWSSRFGTSGRSNDIFGQLFGLNCNPMGEEYQINTQISGNQTEPSIATDPNGNFIVTWQGPGVDEEDIYARLFDTSCQPIGDEFLVNFNTNDRQLCPSVEMDAKGGFVIVWESMSILTEGKKAICGQLFDSSGSKIGNEFVVNEESYNCRNPCVVMDKNGNFVVVWLRDRSSNSIIARLYNSDGTTRTEPFEVSTVKINTLTSPSVAMNGLGCFVVVWDGYPDSGSMDDIHARLYDSNGVALGEQFVVNTIVEGPQQNPQVAINNRGQFMIVWDSKINPDINERDIFAQRFDSSGQPLGDEFQVNTYMTDDQKQPAVAMSQNGEYVVTWQSEDQDSSNWGIFADAGRIIKSADFNGDGFINLFDYCILAEEWLRYRDVLVTDLNEDNIVNFRDLEEFCRQWLILR